MLHVLRLDMGIPDAFGINHDHWAVAALVETTGLVDADGPLQAALADQPTQFRADLRRPFIGAGFAADTDKHMFLENFHNALLLICG